MRLARLFLMLMLPAQTALLGGEFKSSLAYETVPIPAGSMTMQLPLNSYLDTDLLEIPVSIPQTFRIGKYEVTRRLWQHCFEAGACAKPGLAGPDDSPQHPMVKVSWLEAQQFVRWYSKATKRHWRLPTEREWAYAQSLGKGFKANEPSGAPLVKPSYPSGHFGENAWGVADLEGNVWEWTLSCYTLAADRLLAPEDIEKLEHADCCSTRVIVGEHRAGVPDFIDDASSGGCSGAKPAANLGLRLLLVENVRAELQPKSHGLSPLGHFALTDARDGSPLSSAQLRGKVQLVFFGFTHCATVCPLGLANLRQVLSELGPDAARVAPLFISIDPARDTAERMRDFAANFSPQIIPLRGSVTAVAAAMRSFRLEAEKTDVRSPDDYAMQHPAIIYLLDAQGRYVAALASQSNPKALADRIRRTLE